MILDSEAKRAARAAGVDALVIDLDHALGVVLCALARTATDAGDWVFKGGTCLRKAYYRDYRFSEDLDFTVVAGISPAAVAQRVLDAAAVTAPLGVDLLTDEMRVSGPRAGDGTSGITVRVPYRGAVQRRGDPRVIQFHVGVNELLMFPSVQRRLIHPYSDEADVGCDLLVYAIEEIVAEKLRAIAGQRRYAIARDVYDIAVLADRRGDLAAAIAAARNKAAFIALPLQGCAQRFEARRGEYSASWDRHVTALAHGEFGLPFAAAFQTCLDLLASVEAVI